MKTPPKNPQGRTLPKRNYRWKWMAGTAAASAATATAAHAGVVQINLTGNIISTGTNNLSADLTGAGHAEVNMAGSTSHAVTFVRAVHVGFANAGDLSGAYVGNFGANARWTKEGATSSHDAGVVNMSYGVPNPEAAINMGKGAQGSASGLVPITFSDSKINGGAETNALLEVQCDVLGSTDIFIQLTRVIFDNTTPANSLASVGLNRWSPVIGSTKNGVFTAASSDLLGGTSIGGGWFSSPHFGVYYAGGSGWSIPGWIYHTDLGILYVDPSSTSSNMFIYDWDMQAWLSTSISEFPSVYRWSASPSWLYYVKGSNPPRFYNYGTGKYETN